MIAEEASGGHKGTCRDAGAVRAQEVAVLNLGMRVSKIFRPLLGSKLHVKTGDSSNWTSLSICMSISTVISSSALAVSVGDVQVRKG